LLRVAGLHVSIAGTHVLRGVSLSVPGGYGVVVGPSGSGKTTLLRAIAGLIDYTGTIEFMDRRLDGLPPWERGIAMVQQVPGLLPHLSILENIVLAAVQRQRLTRGEALRLARQLLAELGLAGLEHRRPTELSGGQQQRAALAAALATGARLLLLDEPLSHLDRLTAEKLRSLLGTLPRRGVAVLHVTHDLDEALALGTYMAVLHGGRVVTEGPLESVYKCPRSREAAELLGHGIFPGDLAGLEKGSLYSIAPDYVRLVPRSNGDWRVDSIVRERGRLRLTARHVTGRGILHGYHSSSEAAPGHGAPVEPLFIGEPCRLG